ncbi:MAG TPA: MAB_1171c family putative transporter [Actinophytocola sp.]|uniref:MAB_1171c family putative transporter n=1 Tax=Actinophytocola sp. TaxID=1872138 RepID=UPI002DDD5554|nr:MAB_1171c family putative transporter [Actinophytocola sp.]HEV2778722.1 MAB_1171c family putative transporter [Actinophytocola sp.]
MVQAVATCLVLAVLVYLLVRAPGNVPLRAITVTVASFILTVLFSATATAGAIMLGVAPLIARLAQHLGMLIGGYSLIAFYLFSALDRDQARRQAMRQAIPLTVAAVLELVATVGMPADLHTAAATLAYAAPGAAATPPEPTVAVFYLAPNLYLGYACATAVWWTRRYAQGAEPRLRHGLALASVGLAALAVGEVVFVLATTAQWAGLAVPRWVYPLGLWAIIPGTAVFMIGFAYPAICMRLAALRVWWHHRRTYHHLEPLWTLLHQQFPEDTLNQMPAGRWRDKVSLHGVHRRYYRRVIECRDGLVRISPYLTPTSNDDTTSLADRLRDALQARATGNTAPNQAVPVAIPAVDGLDADVRELVALSKAMRHVGPPNPTPQPRH